MHCAVCVYARLPASSNIGYKQLVCIATQLLSKLSTTARVDGSDTITCPEVITASLVT
jgi:hypothetical protein